MATKNPYKHTELLELYEKLVSIIPDLERKGKSMPYTSVNGNMFSFLDANGNLSMRLDEKDRETFIKKYDTRLSEQHGRIMKEYVLVPETILKNNKVLRNYFKKSFEYTNGLKPKGSKKK